MQNINLELQHTGVSEEQILKYQNKVTSIHERLHEEASDETKYVGWLTLPNNIDEYELARIKKCAKKIQSDSDYLLVIGIGGSYLGARAVIESMSHTFNNYLNNNKTKILYVGNNLSTNYVNDLLDVLKDKDFSINVISKSGTTTEPAIGFRIFRELIEEKYGQKEASKRIYVTTDASRGALKQIASDNNYETFVIPDNVGGRYSVLTPVGLLPIAAAGFDIDKLISGAKASMEKYNNPNLLENDCYKYAVTRNILYNNDLFIELLISYEPKLHYFIEWWKQLYGESEGKDGRGIYPSGAEFTTDLHSLGQYIQEGRRNLLETIININSSSNDIVIKNDEKNLDGLNYLTGKTLDFVNKKAMEGTINAHVEGGVPNFIISIDKLDEYNIGALIYFFELACGMSGYILGIDPFNQPGVEKYKKNMFKLLGKPGY